MSKKTKNPFKIPEGYFDSFQDRFMDKLSSYEMEFPKKSGFTVPDNYLETVQSKVTQKLTESEVKIVPLFPYKKVFGIVASIAAMFIILLGFNWNSTENVTFTNLANTDIEAYFDNHELGLSTYDIVEVLPLDGMEISDIIDHQIKDENIVDYLFENLDNFEELNLQDNE